MVGVQERRRETKIEKQRHTEGEKIISALCNDTFHACY